jgi:hypothetical protein
VRLFVVAVDALDDRARHRVQLVRVGAPLVVAQDFDERRALIVEPEDEHEGGRRRGREPQSKLARLQNERAPLRAPARERVDEAR